MADKTTSIYSVKKYYPSETYDKNDIVYVKETIGNTGIPKKFNYYYSLKNGHSGQEPATPSSYWGGFYNLNGENLPYFLWTPSYNTSANHTPRTSTVNFGNGYTQRTPDGIFTDFINLQFTFEQRNQKEATAILHFLKSRKGSESFILKNLPPPYAQDDTQARKRFVCASFSSTYTFYDNYNVNTTLIQVND
jgi:phage-related protein|tara:strand:+ start:6043 stop:6618 length:576 start_codon:yes stop_codon:yes gene_type:complete